VRNVEAVTACLAVAVLVLSVCLWRAHRALEVTWRRYLRELRRAKRLAAEVERLRARNCPESRKHPES
jgi:hypothetical protein